MTEAGHDDGALLARAGEGSEVAFRAVYRRYAEAVYRIAYGLLGNRPDAEDVAQETFVTAWTKARGLRLQSDSALPWLATICRFHALNRRRLRDRNRTVPLDEQAPAAQDIEAQVLDAVLVAAILRDVAGLTELDQRVFALCVVEGRTYREAADELGVPHGAVRNRLSRIRTRVRDNATAEERS